MDIDLDKKIYNEYLNGKKESFEILYSKYKNKIKYFIFNIIKDYDKAEDITQDVFIYIMQNKFKDEYSFKYYIYLIAKSKALSYLNMENRRSEITQKYLLDKNSKSEESLLEIITKEENKQELLDAINKLDEQYRNAMYLVKIEDLSYKQTAEILGQTVQNIKNLIHRGKKELRKTLIKKGFVEMNKVSKVLLIVLCSGILLSGVVFAKDIKNLVNKLITNIFGTYNKGITKAIDNGYDEEIEMEYVESNDVKVKMNQILLDDYNLGIVCDILLNDTEYKNYVESIYEIEFKNTLIIDENNNVLYAKFENQEDFYEYCKKNNLGKGVWGEGCSNGSYTGKIVNKENNNLIFSFYTSSDKFPHSKKLYIKLDAIDLLNRNENLNKTVNGSWEMTIDLEKIAKERKTLEYSITNINDNKTNVIKASLSMSNMKLVLDTNSNKIDFKKLQTRDIKKMNVFDMIPFHEIYLENANGDKFFQTSSGGNGYDTLEKDKIRYYTTFNFTYFDKTETIRIVLPTNKREELIIELKANNF